MDKEMRVPAKYFVLAIGALWIVMACIIKLEIIPSETVQQYHLGGKGGFFPLQLLTYSFMIHPFDWVTMFLVLSMNCLWLWGLSSNSSDWLDAGGFVRLYSLATVVVGAICWAFARTIQPDAAFAGSWVVICTMIGAVAVREPQRDVAIWGRSVRAILHNLLSNAPAALGIPVLILVALQWRGWWPSSVWGCLAMGIFRFSWVGWILIAMAELRMLTVGWLWFLFLLLQLGAAWVIDGTAPLILAVNTILPLAAGIGYGIVSRNLANRRGAAQSA